jgi:hypothetical protein
MDTNEYFANQYFKLLGLIQHEYDFAKFNREVHAVNCANFKDRAEQTNYLLWSAGRLEGMESLIKKIETL